MGRHDRWKQIDWGNPDLTMGDLYGPAMDIDNVQDAVVYLRRLLDHLKMAVPEEVKGKTDTELLAVQKSNLGYYAGYYDAATMRRVNTMFRTTHPIFGGASTTPREAFEAGQRTAKGGKKEKVAAPKRKTRMLLLGD